MDQFRALAAAATGGINTPALLVFSHLRWHFVTQRPQHLLRRASASRPVYFWEEPYAYKPEQVPANLPPEGRLERITIKDLPHLVVLRPHLRASDDLDKEQRRLLNQFMTEQALTRFDAWFYTPMALGFAAHLKPEVTIYDAMDELSAFQDAPPLLLRREAELFCKADVVFTGGRSLYEHKRSQHPHVFAFPSSIEADHFAKALSPQPDPLDQAAIPHPRAGFFGVLDERFDRDMMGEVARLCPEIHFVFLGPIVKVREEAFPHAANIHYLGNKSYAELPGYLAGWDAAMLPFARNEATRFISPTKTPEYLAAGKRVVSTPIRDVVHDYGEAGLVDIAETADAFAATLRKAVHAGENPQWKQAVAHKLARGSWDSTWVAMSEEIERARARSKPMPVGKASTVSHKRHGATPAREQFDYLVIGAGFAGAVLAERLAAGLGRRVLVVDKRPHIAGNAYDFYNEHGLLVHQYGPHIFHTQSEKVFDYLSQFTEWRPYEHRVLAEVDGKRVPIPINLDTINALYGLDLDAAGMERFLSERAEVRAEIRTSEDIVISKVGRELYEKFFKNYTRKQWGVDPSELDASVAGRIPVRLNQDDRYFSDAFQVMPLEGYTPMFERMLSHPNITVMLSTDYREVMSGFAPKTVYTGPIDEFFDYRYGKLPYRSLHFRHETLAAEQFQPVGVVNYPNQHDYTRVTEFKHLTGQQHASTSVVYEYPQAEGDPYYPVPQPANARLYELYRELAEKTPNVYFCGRLANYKYFNMDQVVAQALHLARNIADDESAETFHRHYPLGRASTGPVPTLNAKDAATPRTETLEGVS